MHIDIIPNRGSRPTLLLRESFRENGKVKKRTLANLSSLSTEQIDAIRQILKGNQLASVDNLFKIVKSVQHGHVWAVRTAMKRLGFANLLDSKPSRKRDIVCAMVAAQIINPSSKLAFTRLWDNTTLPSVFNVADATDDDLYSAMDWIVKQQAHIERKLARRHLSQGGQVLYDLSSSYFEGTHCPLAALGYNRDGKKGKLQVNYGLLTDTRGCPVAISVFPGNTSDSTTLMSQIEKARNEFNIKRLVIVGDRGMIGQRQIDLMKQQDGVGWISALKTGAIRKLVDGEMLQMDLFDERNLFEFTHPDFPGERLIACRNPGLGKLRAHKRESLLEATERDLVKICRSITSGRLIGKDRIGMRVGKIINKYKVAKHFKIVIGERSLEWSRKIDEIAIESALDGIYVIRTSVKKDDLSTEDAVRSYKELANVERAFRSMKTMDLEVRPIRHYLEDRVRAHFFLCMLAYYVKWYINEAWRPLLFSDEEIDSKMRRNPVEAAERSAIALNKVSTKQLPDGRPVHSFQTLIKKLSGIVRNFARSETAKNAAIIEIDTTPDAIQEEAIRLLEAMDV
jgi:transposase